MHLKDNLDPGTLRRQWRIQRAGWVVMALLLLAAAAGAFGKGPLSGKSQEASAGGMDAEVEYDAWSRTKSEQDLTVTVAAPGQPPGGPLTLTLSEGFVSGAGIRHISPPPDSVRLGPDGPVYEWSVDDWSKPVSVSFRYSPDMAFGLLRGEARVKAGNASELTIPIEQVLYP